MLVYRLEHVETGLGPFQHAGQITEIILKGVYGNKDKDGNVRFVDLDDISEVKKIVKKFKRKIRYGYRTYEQLTFIIKDIKVLSNHGFIIAIYNTPILYEHSDGQVIFNIDDSNLLHKIYFN